MPKKDGTGPKGKGPLTGRGGGKCVIPLSTPEEEMDFLKNQKRVIKEHLEKIQARIADLEANEE